MVEAGEEQEVFDIKKVEIEPETCSIEAPVKLALSFQVTKPLKGITWTLDYIVDSTGKRLSFQIYQSPSP